jgi:hypothetical protein
MKLGLIQMVETNRSLYMGGHSANWRNVSTKIPPSEYKKLMERYPTRGQAAKVVRALIQMHLSGKIKDLQFTITENL